MPSPKELLTTLESPEVREITQAHSARIQFRNQQTARLRRVIDHFIAQRAFFGTEVPEITTQEEDGAAFTVHPAMAYTDILAVSLVTGEKRIELGQTTTKGQDVSLVLPPFEPEILLSSLVRVTANPKGGYTAEIDRESPAATEGRLTVWQAILDASDILDAPLHRAK